MKKIVISVCTYRRPRMLEALFDTLSQIRIPDGVLPSARIIDNDDTPSSRAVAETIAARMPWPVGYVHEREPGIPAARNRALAEADDQDFLAFVDDDETVPPHWLQALWDVRNRTGAHFVQGPLIPTVKQDEDEWWIRTRLFKQQTFPDCAERGESWTNNVLIDLAFVRDRNIRFDMALRYDGGSDTLFFQDMVRQGAKGVYAAHAMAYEVQPENRLTWKWALARQFRYGTTRALCALLRQERGNAGLHCVVRAVACAGAGIALLPLSLVRGRIGLADASAYLARAVGIVWGLLGKRHLEYERRTCKEA